MGTSLGIMKATSYAQTIEDHLRNGAQKTLEDIQCGFREGESKAAQNSHIKHRNTHKKLQKLD